MKSGRMTFVGEDQSRYDVELRELTTMYLRGGGYAGYQGVTHGLWLGHEWSDGETWNVSDPAVANEVHGLDDTVVEVKCNGKVGYGIIENLVMPPFPKYGFPAMPVKRP